MIKGKQRKKMSHLFIRDLKDYKSTFNPVENYKKQAIHFLKATEKMTNREAEEALERVLEKSPLIDPRVNFHYRKENLDKIKKTTSLIKYIENTINNEEHIAPSFTTYLNPKIRKSKQSKFVVHNLDKRKVTKTKMFKAKEDGDEELRKSLFTLQLCYKISNNSMSGAYSLKSISLSNPSAHYTLTTVTRALASTGNVIAESMLSGKRIYRTPESVYGHFLALTEDLDNDNIKRVVEKYRLTTPTVEDVMGVVRRSAIEHWESEDELKSIEMYVSKMSDMERVAVTYSTDWYHIKKFNEDFMRGFYTRATTTKSGLTLNHKEVLDNVQGWELNLITHYFMDDLRKLTDDKAKGFKIRYDTLYQKDKMLLDKIVSTILYVRGLFNSISDLINAFFKIDTMVINAAFTKDIIRESVVMSDTDSSVFSCDNWVEWFFGKHSFGTDQTRVAALTMTIHTEVISHQLKLLGRNMGVKGDVINLFDMKNEYYFETFNNSTVSKMYFASVDLVEGLVMKDKDIEIKGKLLIAGNVYEKYRDFAKDLMRDINNKMSNNEKINLEEVLTKVADVEREIIDKIKSGDGTILNSGRVNEAETYKQKEKAANIVAHNFWKETFGYKYGMIEEPPYETVVIKTWFNGKRGRLNDWLDNMEDRELSNKIKAWMKKNKKETIGTIRIPKDILKVNSIPLEVMDAMDVNGIINSLMKASYIALETLGFFLNKNTTEYKDKKKLLIDLGY